MGAQRQTIMFADVRRGFMSVPRLFVLPFLVSVCFAVQVAGNVRQDGNVYICVGQDTVQTPWKNPFLSPAFGQGGISLTDIVPPPELRAHDLTRGDACGVSPFNLGPPRKPIECQIIHSDGRGRFH